MPISEEMGQLLSDKIVTLDIMASAAVRPALTVGSQTMGVALIIAVPLLVLTAGLCVLLPLSLIHIYADGFAGAGGSDAGRIRHRAYGSGQAAATAAPAARTEAIRLAAL